MCHPSRYYAIGIELEALQGNPPYKPVWVKAYNDEIDKLKPKRLPMTDVHVLDQFKKFYGFKKAIKYKVSSMMTSGFHAQPASSLNCLLGNTSALSFV